MRRSWARGLLHLSLGLVVGGVVLSPAHLASLEAAGSIQEQLIGLPAELRMPLHDAAVLPASDLTNADRSDGAGSAEGAIADPSSAELLVGSPDSNPTLGPAAGSVGPLAPRRYTVQSGESLALIATRFGIDVPTLLGSNDLDDPDFIQSGLELKVLPVPGVLYHVAEGDTLNRIAWRYEVAVREILRANDLASSELLVPGQELVLPGAHPVVAGVSASFGRSPLAADSSPAATTRDPSVVAEAPPASTARQPEPRRLASSIETRPVAPPVHAVQAPARGTFAWPASGPITTHFGEIGWLSPRGHSGLDISTPWGAPVVAAAPGQVVLATRAGGGYGIEVVIDHGGGTQTLYAHLSELDVLGGERVARGQLIGLVGSSGFSTGPHLHFEVQLGGVARDPLGFLP